MLRRRNAIYETSCAKKTRWEKMRRMEATTNRECVSVKKKEKPERSVTKEND